MRFFKYLIFTFLLLVMIVIAVGLFLPANTQVERSVVVAAEPGTVYPFLSDLKEFTRWSPWTQDDAGMLIEYSGPEAGVGSVMSWQSPDAATGSGRQEITVAEPNERVEVVFEFGEAGKAKSVYLLEPVEKGTRVSWSLSTDHGMNILQRYVGLLMEENLGPVFEQGLGSLKRLVESLPAIVTEEISYTAGEADLQGYLAKPRNSENRPAVLVVHEWWGHNEYVRERAEMLAELGYVAFALDMYGEGKLAEHPEDAQAFMTAVTSNKALARARFDAALALVKSLPETDSEKTAAIGYCFGGAMVLSMARAGADLDGVVSFHGALGDLPPVAEDVAARFLVLNGGADPFVTDEQIANFKSSMKAAGADYRFVEYPGVRHAFTNPAATKKGDRFGLPLEYDAEADADSWNRMKAFLQDVFESQEP